MKLKMDYKWVALSVTNVGSFMAALDSSIVVIGLPTILQNLHANIEEGVWIIAGYKLMITILLVMFGRLADLYGRVKLYNLGFVIFTIGSLLCALSQTGEDYLPVPSRGGRRPAYFQQFGNYHRRVPEGRTGHRIGNEYDGGEFWGRRRLHSQRHNDYLFRLAVNVPG